MSKVVSFQRARKPEEREVRREAILAAAAELFDLEGPQGTGLNAIAARAGFTKSNVYRYFESREQVLLSLLLDAFDELTSELETVIAKLPPNDVTGLSRAAAEGFARRPRLGLLLAILSTVIEQNVSEQTVIELKREMAAMLQRTAKAIQSNLVGTSLEDCAWATGMVGALAAGMWPNAHPSPMVQTIMSMPEFATLKPVIDRDLARATRALLTSILPSSRA